jgi:hypothetical protein
LARYDLGLSDEEFADLTPGEFQALCKRRNTRIKYERYANALTASAVYNVNRHSDDTPAISAFDFIRDDASAEKADKLRKAKMFCKKVIAGLGMSATKEKMVEVRAKAIVDLKASGYENAEEIFDGCWPSLRPQEGQS